MNWYKKAQYSVEEEETHPLPALSDRGNHIVETVEINNQPTLTYAQKQILGWLAGIPLFDYDITFLTEEHGLDEQTATEIYNDIQNVKKAYQNDSLQNPQTEFVKDELIDNLQRLILMTDEEGYGEYLLDFRQYPNAEKKARAKANAQTRAIKNLISKIKQ